MRSFKFLLFILVIFCCGITAKHSYAWTNLGGGDHGSDDWIISTDTLVAGQHTNVGLFRVESGVTVTVKAYDGSQYGIFEVTATSIDVQGTINGNGAGYRNGTGGATTGTDGCRRGGLSFRN